MVALLIVSLRERNLNASAGLIQYNAYTFGCIRRPVLAEPPKIRLGVAFEALCHADALETADPVAFMSARAAAMAGLVEAVGHADVHVYPLRPRARYADEVQGWLWRTLSRYFEGMGNPDPRRDAVAMLDLLHIHRARPAGLDVCYERAAFAQCPALPTTEDWPAIVAAFLANPDSPPVAEEIAAA
jgi:hypothetical protein